MTAPFDVIDAYNRLLQEIEPLLFVARDSSLQRAGGEALRAFVDRADQVRLAAMMERDEEGANHLLAFRSAARALAFEMDMYLLLKADKPEEAWNALIQAQGELGAAARAHRSFDHLEPKAQNLRELERTLFPPQIFMSAGMIVREQRCSICNDSYEKCDHIAGRPYMGRFCSVLLQQVSLDHVAIVDDPADRLCRVTSFKVPGGIRNRMTWAVVPDGDAEAKEGSLEAIVATANAEDAGEEVRPAA